MGVPAETLGERVRRLRMATGMSQKRFGEEIGLRANTITALERDESDPHLATLRAVAGALGVEVSELLEGLRWLEATP